MLCIFKWGQWMNQLIALISGIVFGIGLIQAGMTDPAKVIGFLDVAGNWNPSLAFVMASAIPITFVAFKWLGKRQRTLLGEPVHLPGTHQIDMRLIIGGVLFGIGWALAGYCPGPAIVSLGAGHYRVLYLIIPMLFGMKLVDWASNFLKKE